MSHSLASIPLPLSPSLPSSTDRDRFHYCSQSGPSGQLLCSTVHLNIILLIKGVPPHQPQPWSIPALFSHGACLLFTQALTHSLHVKPRSCHLKRGDVTFVSTPFHVALISTAILHWFVCVCECVYKSLKCVYMSHVYTGMCWVTCTVCVWGSSSLGLIRVKSASKRAWLPVIGCW